VRGKGGVYNVEELWRGDEVRARHLVDNRVADDCGGRAAGVVGEVDGLAVEGENVKEEPAVVVIFFVVMVVIAGDWGR